jgi:hypothetical protein
MNTIFLLLLLLPDQQDRQKPRVEERTPDRVLEWNEHALECIRRDKTAPPVAARNLAVVHCAIYDAVNTIRETHKPYLVSLRAVEDTDPHVAAAAAAHRALVSIYPAQKDRLDVILTRYLDTVPRGSPKSRGITLGRYVADRILAARKDDLKPRNTTYRPLNDVGFWRPTSKVPPMLPHWGETKPFAVKSVRAFRVPAPPKLTSDDYADEFEDVKSIGGRLSRKRTAEQSIIAWFWNDNAGTCTPPGHWNQIARVASLTCEETLTLAENARLFALLNLALADASIACWECKYRFELWRPVTAIREADRDGNERTQADAKWEPLLTTPPFPSYTSGHSTFSGAAAAVLEKFETDRGPAFGDAFGFRIGSDDFQGTKRAYKSFDDAAKEAGKSRIYGGIHYESDNREGLKLGRAVAEEVCRTRLLKEE